MAGLTLAGAAQASGYPELRVVAVCTAGQQSGDFRCYDTLFASQDFRDCTDRPAEAPIGYFERGGGVLAWGNMVAGDWRQDGWAVYEGSGWQVVSGNTVRAILTVDEDRVFGDGFDRDCQKGRFVP